jgi:crotonobetainyl-CoA:carnitine CoA-transferase CaiB-like acyl-CoA transferase
MVGNAVHLDRTPPRIDRPPPVLGEHTQEILISLGYPADKIASMRERGVI